MKNKLTNRLLIVILALALTLAATSAFAADGKPVSYKSGDETVQGVLYRPSGKGPFPALVVIHEFWGLNDWVKEQASKLAE
jgi:carboxymethylenebutenolidase